MVGQESVVRPEHLTGAGSRAQYNALVTAVTSVGHGGTGTGSDGSQGAMQSEELNKHYERQLGIFKVTDYLFGRQQKVFSLPRSTSTGSFPDSSSLQTRPTGLSVNC